MEHNEQMEQGLSWRSYPMDSSWQKATMAASLHRRRLSWLPRSEQGSESGANEEQMGSRSAGMIGSGESGQAKITSCVPSGLLMAHSGSSPSSSGNRMPCHAMHFHMERLRGFGAVLHGEKLRSTPTRQFPNAKALFQFRGTGDSTQRQHGVAWRARVSPLASPLVSPFQ